MSVTLIFIYPTNLCCYKLQPETEVKWHCDSIEEIVIVYVRIQKQHSCLRLLHSTSTSTLLIFFNTTHDVLFCFDHLMIERMLYI